MAALTGRVVQWVGALSRTRFKFSLQPGAHTGGNGSMFLSLCLSVSISDSVSVSLPL